jgi:hypothetical protein
MSWWSVPVGIALGVKTSLAAAMLLARGAGDVIAAGSAMAILAGPGGASFLATGFIARAALPPRRRNRVWLVLIVGLLPLVIFVSCLVEVMVSDWIPPQSGAKMMRQMVGKSARQPLATTSRTEAMAAGRDPTSEVRFARGRNRLARRAQHARGAIDGCHLTRGHRLPARWAANSRPICDHEERLVSIFGRQERTSARGFAVA